MSYFAAASPDVNPHFSPSPGADRAASGDDPHDRARYPIAALLNQGKFRLARAFRYIVWPRPATPLAAISGGFHVRLCASRPGPDSAPARLKRDGVGAKDHAMYDSIAKKSGAKAERWLAGARSSGPRRLNKGSTHESRHSGHFRLESHA